MMTWWQTSKNMIFAWDLSWKHCRFLYWVDTIGGPEATNMRRSWLEVSVELIMYLKLIKMLKKNQRDRL